MPCSIQHSLSIFRVAIYKKKLYTKLMFREWMKLVDLTSHSYQVSSKSIKRFWRRSRKCEKLTDGRRAMTIAHSSLRLR